MEARRTLRVGGALIVAEVASRINGGGGGSDRRHGPGLVLCGCSSQWSVASPRTCMMQSHSLSLHPPTVCACLHAHLVALSLHQAEMGTHSSSMSLACSGLIYGRRTCPTPCSLCFSLREQNASRIRCALRGLLTLGCTRSVDDLTRMTPTGQALDYILPREAGREPRAAEALQHCPQWSVRARTHARGLNFSLPGTAMSHVHRNTRVRTATGDAVELRRYQHHEPSMTLHSGRFKERRKRVMAHFWLTPSTRKCFTLSFLPCAASVCAQRACI